MGHLGAAFHCGQGLLPCTVGRLGFKEELSKTAAQPTSVGSCWPVLRGLALPDRVTGAQSYLLSGT